MKDDRELGKTAEDIRRDIEALKKGKSGDIPADVPNNPPEMPARASLIDKPEDPSLNPEPQPGPQAAKNPERESAPHGQADDPIEWAKNKGFKTPEDIANSLRNLEREFHKRNQQTKEKSQSSPPHQSAPPPQWNQPAYVPDREAMLQHYAKKYDMHVDDFKKVLGVADDITKSRMAELQGMFQRELNSIKKTTAKNADLMEVMRNPAFKDPQVQREIHRVFEENPALFETDNAYSSAFEKALMNIAIKSIEVGQRPGIANNGDGLPTAPPNPSGGQGGGIPGVKSEEVTPETFAKMSLEDQQKYLGRMKVRSGSLY